MSVPSLLRRILVSLGFLAPEPEPEARAALPPPSPPTVPDAAADEEHIPSSSRERVAQIRALIETLEARAAERRGVGEVAELERIKSRHLPALLRSYSEIPPEFRAEVFRETGRSASYQLNERLDKMAARIREISKLLAQGELDAFKQSIQFIDNQYDSTFSPFD